jgi:Nif-specific regulatory protein
MHRYAKQLETLSLVSDCLSKNGDTREILFQILRLLEKNLGLVRGTILLLSSDGKNLTIEAVHSADNEIDTDIRYQWGEGIVGGVVSNGQPMIIPKISQEPLFRDRIHQRRKSLNEEISFICVPIKIEHEIVGTLSVDLPFSNENNLSQELKILQIVSSMISHDVNSRRTASRQREALEAENVRLRDALGENFRPENMIGNSKSMHDVYTRVHHVCTADTTVLIRGESGTGKELIASAIHFNSPRKERKYIKVNCAALSENLLESELFGHEKGAFTGAIAMRTGRIEEAEGGTLFLDEIGEISMSIQVKLLRFLQEKEFERIGSNNTIRADVRIIAATNRDLEQAIVDNAFRKDLYYRINVFPVFLPPLRARKEDILPLANHFVSKYSSKNKKNVRRISTPAISMMMEYHWPGNVRELENCIEHAVLVCYDGVIHGYDLPPTLQMPSYSEIKFNGKLKDRTDALERDMIIDALKHTNGNVNIASKELGITSRMVRYKIERLGIDYKQYLNLTDDTQ